MQWCTVTRAVLAVAASPGDAKPCASTRRPVCRPSRSLFALVSEAMGCKEARRRIGVNATGLAFNSVMAVELNEDPTMNSMVNANGGGNADGADGKCGH